MAGRPPTPDSIKQIAGTIRPDRQREDVPIPQPGEVVKPKVLKGRASKLWDEYAPGLIAMGTVTWADVHILAEWCQLTAQWEKEKGEMQAALRTVRKALGTELGIGAVSRVKAGTKKGKKKDAADEFFENAS